MIDLVVARTPMKDLRDHIEEERIITPADWEEEHNIYYGATFNLAHNLTQMLWFRPRIVRGSQELLPCRRRNPSGQRPADHLRIGEDNIKPDLKEIRYPLQQTLEVGPQG